MKIDEFVAWLEANFEKESEKFDEPPWQHLVKYNGKGKYAGKYLLHDSNKNKFVWCSGTEPVEFSKLSWEEIAEKSIPVLEAMINS